MELLLKRIALKETYTIGHLYLDGVFFCDTLEDRHRPDGVKIQDETCIPEGRYKVEISYSPHFKRMMPAILDVPGFVGIRIHSGVKAADTSGCPLVGENKIVGGLINSRTTYDKLFDILDHSPDDIYITITLN